MNRETPRTQCVPGFVCDTAQTVPGRQPILPCQIGVRQMEKVEMILMNRPNLVPTATAGAPRRHYGRGRWIFRTGGLAVPCRVISGAVRIDSPGDEPESMQIAWAGDLIGLEALQVRAPVCDVRALVGTVVERLAPMSDAQWCVLLLNELLKRQSPDGGLGQLRCGRISERLRRMLLLLAGRGQAVEGEPTELQRPILCELPRLAEMAAIAATSAESVSRVVSNLRRAGLIEKQLDHRVELSTAFLLSDAELPDGLTCSRARAEARLRTAALTLHPAYRPTLWPVAAVL
jgi:hypothetical protein